MLLVHVGKADPQVQQLTNENLAEHLRLDRILLDVLVSLESKTLDRIHLLGLCRQDLHGLLGVLIGEREVSVCRVQYGAYVRGE